MPRDNENTNEDLLQVLLDNPETRKDALKLMKKARPGMAIPELDIEASAADLVTKAREEDKKVITDLESKVLKMEVSKRLDDQRRDVVAKGIVTEAEIPAVEKLITDMNFPNYETAARYFFAQKQLAPPTPEVYHKRPFESLGVDFIKDPVGSADKIAHELVDSYDPNHILRH